MKENFNLFSEEKDWEESQSTIFLDEEVLQDLLIQDDLQVVPTGGSLRWKEE